MVQLETSYFNFAVYKAFFSQNSSSKGKWLSIIKYRKKYATINQVIFVFSIFVLLDIDNI